MSDSKFLGRIDKLFQSIHPNFEVGDEVIVYAAKDFDDLDEHGFECIKLADGNKLYRNNVLIVDEILESGDLKCHFKKFSKNQPDVVATVPAKYLRRTAKNLKVGSKVRFTPGVRCVQSGKVGTLVKIAKTPKDLQFKEEDKNELTYWFERDDKKGSYYLCKSHDLVEQYDTDLVETKNFSSTRFTIRSIGYHAFKHPHYDGFEVYDMQESKVIYSAKTLDECKDYCEKNKLNYDLCIAKGAHFSLSTKDFYEINYSESKDGEGCWIVQEPLGKGDLLFGSENLDECIKWCKDNHKKYKINRNFSVLDPKELDKRIVNLICRRNPVGLRESDPGCRRAFLSELCQFGFNEVDTKWEPPEGLFKDGSSLRIAREVWESHDKDLKRSIACINFYLNRAGKNLSKERIDVLEAAKDRLYNWDEKEHRDFSAMTVVSENPGKDSQYTQVLGVDEIKLQPSSEKLTKEDLDNRLIESSVKEHEMAQSNNEFLSRLQSIIDSKDKEAAEKENKEGTESTEETSTEENQEETSEETAESTEETQEEETQEDTGTEGETEGETQETSESTESESTEENQETSTSEDETSTEENPDSGEETSEENEETSESTDEGEATESTEETSESTDSGAETNDSSEETQEETSTSEEETQEGTEENQETSTSDSGTETNEQVVSSLDQLNNSIQELKKSIDEISNPSTESTETADSTETSDSSESTETADSTETSDSSEVAEGETQENSESTDSGTETSDSSEETQEDDENEEVDNQNGELRENDEKDGSESVSDEVKDTVVSIFDQVSKLKSELGL